MHQECCRRAVCEAPPRELWNHGAHCTLGRNEPPDGDRLKPTSSCSARVKCIVGPNLRRVAPNPQSHRAEQDFARAEQDGAEPHGADPPERNHGSGITRAEPHARNHGFRAGCRKRRGPPHVEGAHGRNARVLLCAADDAERRGLVSLAERVVLQDLDETCLAILR